MEKCLSCGGLRKALLHLATADSFAPCLFIPLILDMKQQSLPLPRPKKINVLIPYAAQQGGVLTDLIPSSLSILMATIKVPSLAHFIPYRFRGYSLSSFPTLCSG